MAFLQPAHLDFDLARDALGSIMVQVAAQLLEDAAHLFHFPAITSGLSSISHHSFMEA